MNMKKTWDTNTPSPEYFAELRRISENQIIWGGGNYFVLPPSRCWIVWDKTLHGNTFADGELAWTNYDKNVRIYPLNICHIASPRIHPTQKPVKLYEWLLKNYAKPGDRILDAHGGSMSSAIACYNMGFDLTLCELDLDYYNAGVKRFEDHKRQGRLFEPC